MLKKTANLTFFLGFSALAVQAASYRVAVNGTDDPNCGGASFPCATIGTAIDNARDGDTILVDPGYYPQESEGTCGVRIDKELSLRSVEGAEVTIIGEADIAVCIAADNVIFGLHTNGFTLTASNTGLVVEDDVSEAYVGGNIAIDNSEIGFLANGHGHTFFRNLAIGNGEEGFLFYTNDTEVVRNKAFLNGGTGYRFSARVECDDCLTIETGESQDDSFPDENEVLFNLSMHNDGPGFHFDDLSAGNVADRNVTSFNEDAGFELNGSAHSVRRLVAVGNGDEGILVYGAGHEVFENHAVSNDEEGISVEADDTLVTRNNLYGNRHDDTADNCGLENRTGLLLVAPFNFFGDRMPAADTICGDPIERNPIAGSEFGSPLSWVPIP